MAKKGKKKSKKKQKKKKVIVPVGSKATRGAQRVRVTIEKV